MQKTCRVLRNSIGTRNRRFADVAQTRLPEGRVHALLQKTVSLLPRTLSITKAGPESAEFWSSLLERTVAELSPGSNQAPSKATITICSFDKSASSYDLVTALLEDPFCSDATYADILRNRWKNAPSCVSIEYGKPAAFAGELSSPSSWLQRFRHAVQLTELPNLSSLSGISDERDTLLLNSDVLVLLSDPLVTPLADLAVRAKHLLDKSNTILVLVSSSSSDQQFVSRTLSKMGCRPGHVLFVDPGQALDAITALQANPTSPSAIDRYQRDTLSSRISTVTTAIDEMLGPEGSSKASLADLRQKTALSQLHCSLSASFRSVDAAKKDAELVADRVEDLLLRVQRARETCKVLGKPGGDDEIEKAVSLGAREMSALLGSLTFWKMVWRADEIGAIVSTAVQGRWCRELENQLILHTGRLESVQREMTVSAFDLVSASSGSLCSPVLENGLEQLKRLPANVLTPSSLTEPIRKRRVQLIRYTTGRLQRESQSAVMGAFGGTLGGVGLGWWLAFGEHFLSLGIGAEMGTAIGTGALVAVGSIRWAVGKWERAKRRWLQDSERVGQGLTRDLENTLLQTVDDKVTVVASTACKGMQDLIERRRDEACQVHEALCELDAEVRTEQNGKPDME